MKERPILLSGDWVRAILDGRKSQTRRPIVPTPPTDDDVIHRMSGDGYLLFTDHHTPGLWRVAGPVWAVRELMGDRYPKDHGWRCPFGVPGDQLYVREMWIAGYDCEDGVLAITDDEGDDLPEKVWYAADGELTEWLGADGEMHDKIPWKSSLLMPRELSRIDLEITAVRAERVQSITVADAIAEGVAGPHEFRAGWESIYGKRGHPWASNPWVWVVSFDVVKIKSGTEPATVGAKT